MKNLFHYYGAMLLVCVVPAFANLSDARTVTSLEAAAREGKSPRFSLTVDEAKENPATVLDLRRMGVRFDVTGADSDPFLAQLEETFVSDSISDAEIVGVRKIPFTFYFGLGLSSVNYSGEMRSTFDSIRSVANVSHSAFDLDLMGVYWTLPEYRLLVGGVLNLVTEKWSDSSAAVTMKDYILSASALYFPFGNPGEGFYLRGDVGVARYDFGVEYLDQAYSYGDSAWGVGMLVGAGYAFPLWRDLKGSLKVSYSYRTADRSNAGVVAAGAGLFF